MAAVRYDVTPYSQMHLGHAWCAYRAWLEARRSGAEFLMQFDDQGYHDAQLWRQSYSLERGCELFREDLEWLGLHADRYELVTRHKPAYEAAARQIGLKPPRPVEFTGTLRQPVAIAGVITCPAWSALAHVICDRENNVEMWVRGNEFVTQHDLYHYLWRKLAPGVPPVPSYEWMVWREGMALKESKSDGDGCGVRDLREAGWTPAEVIDSLRECERRKEPESLRITIPAGVLTPDGDALRFPFAEVLKAEVVLAEGKPWEQDVADAVRERAGGQHADRNQR